MAFRKFDTQIIYFWLLSLVAFTIPLPMLFNNIVVIVLLSFWLFLIFKRETKISEFRAIIMLIVPYLLVVIGAFYSQNSHQASIELIKGLPFLLLPLIIFTLPFKICSNNLKQVLKGFVLGNILVCLVLLFVILDKVLTEHFSIQTLYSLTHQSLSLHVKLNAIYLSLYISLSLTVVFYFLLTTRKILSVKFKVIIVAVSLLFSFILVLLSSRTVMLSCIVVNSAMFIYYQLKKYSLLKVVAQFSLVIVFLSIMIFAVNPIFKWRIESMFDTQDQRVSSNKEEGIKMRYRLWTSSLEVFKENRLFGVGTGDFKDELEKVYKDNNYRIQYRHHMNSHNQYLSYIVSNGIVGLFLFTFYLLYCFQLFYRTKNPLSLFILFTIVFCFFTESHLYTNKGIILVAFFLTLLVKHAKDTIQIMRNEKD